MKKLFSWRMYIFLSVLQFLMVLIKIANIFIYSWWFVFTPLYMILILFGIEFCILYNIDDK